MVKFLKSLKHIITFSNYFCVTALDSPTFQNHSKFTFDVYFSLILLENSKIFCTLNWIPVWLGHTHTKKKVKKKERYTKIWFTGKKLSLLWMLPPPGFYYVKKTKRFVILSSDKSSERNLSCFFDMIKPRRGEHL